MRGVRRRRPVTAIAVVSEFENADTSSFSIEPTPQGRGAIEDDDGERSHSPVAPRVFVDLRSVGGRD